MKIISWNVNGIRAMLSKDFLATIATLNPDILCLQETKANPAQVDKILASYPHQYWNNATKKGYSGTAIFSKHKPINVTYDIGIPEHDDEGRVITAEFAAHYLVNVYVPNSGRGLVRLAYRATWDASFLAYLKNLEKTKPVILCGDLNVAHTALDLKNPKSNYNKTSGFTQQEIDGIQSFFDAGFVDTFRMFTKEGGHYTYWSYMFSARTKNIGWRIDYFLVSSSLKPKIEKSEILADVMGSDHCPVQLTLVK